MMTGWIIFLLGERVKLVDDSNEWLEGTQEPALLTRHALSGMILITIPLPDACAATTTDQTLGPRGFRLV